MTRPQQSCDLPPPGVAGSPYGGRHPGDHPKQPFYVDGLRDVFEDAGLMALPDVLLHAVSAERDARHSLTLLQVPHEVEPVPIREPQVTDDQVEVVVLALALCGRN